MWRVVVAVWLGVMPSVALSENLSGNDMVQPCITEYETNPSLRLFCVGYIIGTVEAMRYGASFALLHSKFVAAGDDPNIVANLALNVCLPEGTENGQLIDVFRKWLIENPKDRHQQASFLIQIAVSESFPCY